MMAGKLNLLNLCTNFHIWLSELGPVNIHFYLEPKFQLVQLTMTNG